VKIFRDPASYISGFYYEEPMVGLPVLTHCGEVLCVPGHRLQPHQHTGFEFLYLARGRIDWRVRGQTFSQGDGDLFASYPGEWHSTAAPARNETHHLWIGLDLDHLGVEGRRLARLLRRGHVRLLRGCHAIEPVLRAIVRQIITPLPGQKAVVLGYLRLLMILIEQHLRLQEEPPGTAALPYSYGVQKAIAYMEKCLDRRISLAELSAVATVRQASHFCARFRREVGTTPVAYHFNLRLAAARDGLLQPEAGITEVALRFGFSSSQHFSSAFRRAFKTTPRLWRNRSRLIPGKMTR
jgi:AraC-like DNA-binding protein